MGHGLSTIKPNGRGGIGSKYGLGISAKCDPKSHPLGCTSRDVGGGAVHRAVYRYYISPATNYPFESGRRVGVWSGLGIAVDGGGGSAGGGGGICPGAGGGAGVGQTQVGEALVGVERVFPAAGCLGFILGAAVADFSLRIGELWGGVSGDFLAGLSLDFGAGNPGGGRPGGVAGQWAGGGAGRVALGRFGLGGAALVGGTGMVTALNRIESLGGGFTQSTHLV